MQGLGDLAGGIFLSEATGVSADGSTIVGGSRGVNGAEAFRWTETGGMFGLGDLDGGDFYSVATGVSADGSTIVGASESSNGVEAFRWTESGGMQGLGFLDATSFYSQARGASADGSTIVGINTSDNGAEEAFVWTGSEGMQSLYDILSSQGDDLSGWQSLNRAQSISADGNTIVGYGINANGNEEAFFATLSADSSAVPEPASTFLLGASSLGLLYMRRRKKKSTNQDPKPAVNA